MIRSDLALAALASAAIPGMKPVAVTGVRPDRDRPPARYQTAYVEDATGRQWVVRVPLNPTAGAELERNDPLVRLLGRHLPFKVPTAAGYASVGKDGRAAVYPRVEGYALELRHLPAGAGLAGAVGRAIAAVHNIPRGLYEEMGVPGFDASGCRARKLALLDRAAETGHVPTGLLARWEQALEASPLWQFATTPVHGSLDGESFLVAFNDDDAATGRVVALSGWEHAEIADPADDLAALVEQASPRATDTVVESYALARSQRPDPYIIQRARLTAEMRLLTGLAGAVAAGDEAFVRARADQLRKLDRLTSTDDSLVPRTALVTMQGPALPDWEDEPEAAPQEYTAAEQHGDAEEHVPTVEQGDEPHTPATAAVPPAPEQADPAEVTPVAGESATGSSGPSEPPPGPDPADATEEIPVEAADDAERVEAPDEGVVTDGQVEDEPAPAPSDEASTDETATDAGVGVTGTGASEMGDGSADAETERLQTLYDMPAPAEATAEATAEAAGRPAAEAPVPDPVEDPTDPGIRPD